MKIAIRILIPIMLATQAVFAAESVVAARLQDAAEIRGELRKGELYRVRLDDDILRNCAGDCANLRIFDQQGAEIPYAIIESRGKTTAGTNYIFEIIGYEKIPGGEAITIRLPEKHDLISAIRIQTSDRDFKKDVVVKGSHDMRSWAWLLRDSIWDFSSQVDFRKTELKVPESGYRFYKLTFTDATKREDKEEDAIRLKYRDLEFSADNAKSGKVHIDTIEAGSPPLEMRAVYDSAVLTRFSTRREGNCTVVDIEGFVPFERISFDIANPYYFRNVQVYYSPTGKQESYYRIGSGQLFRFPFADRVETGNTLVPIDTGKGHYRFVIDNRNNPPLDIRSLKVEWVRRYIYFMALRDSPLYKISFGDSSFLNPDYDITHFINQGNWRMHSAQDLEPIIAMRPPGQKSGASAWGKESIERILLVSIVLLLVIIIGYWLYTLVRNADSRK